MNITIKNGKLYGNAIIDMTHRVELDKQTLENLQKTKPPCWILSDNIYSSYCGIDKAPCNGNMETCHMLKKWEERVRKENELSEVVQDKGARQGEKA